MANIADKVFELIKPYVEKEGVALWDVRYIKEGASWYLRVFIDKEDGISIDDCSNVSHAIDPVLDEADPIDGSYYLEVCSPGIERELIRPEHYLMFLGKTVVLKLFKAYEGSKELKGKLISCDNEICIEISGEQIKLDKKAVSKTILSDFE